MQDLSKGKSMKLEWFDTLLVPLLCQGELSSSEMKSDGNHLVIRVYCRDQCVYMYIGVKKFCWITCNLVKTLPEMLLFVRMCS